MQTNNKKREIFIYDGKDTMSAFKRTTHLGVFAHQDDTEFLAFHGILECYNAKDKFFSAVIVTDGAGNQREGKYKNYTDAEMMDTRKSEQRKAAELGKYATLTQLMHPSSEVKKGNDSVIDDLYYILMLTKPQVIYTHNLADKHDTHVATALRLIEAIREMPKEIRPKIVLGCECWRDLDWMNDKDKIILDVSKNQELARSLADVFESQIEGVKNINRAIFGRRIANATFSVHNTDTTHSTIAMDLTPLAHNDTLSIEDYILSFIDKFSDDVAARLRKFK